MSRAVLIDAARPQVEAMCARRGVAISVIEALSSGGTRVVLNTMADADVIRLAYKAKLITTPVRRVQWANK